MTEQANHGGAALRERADARAHQLSDERQPQMIRQLAAINELEVDGVCRSDERRGREASDPAVGQALDLRRRSGRGRERVDRDRHERALRMRSKQEQRFDHHVGVGELTALELDESADESRRDRIPARVCTLVSRECTDSLDGDTPVGVE